ncbi:hypothetical protein [Caldimonas brevitalea]|uniref:Uncharacterized protein n=1 Tax=Caldimonas brevitalea TaxID=413882 RepID=A0A0G3BS63_9BURK|nr:hypothetical protein [Caldimonas brevitalea]AKJ30256.1 hypothetical protein AAW51_3565 [Caldimonas brevitalea]
MTTTNNTDSRRRNLRLYFLGHGAILLGAWGMDHFGSMVPMALAASAALMLSAPLVRQQAARLRLAARRRD